MSSQQKKKQLGKAQRRIRPSMLMQIEESDMETSGRSNRSNFSNTSTDSEDFDYLQSVIETEDKATTPNSSPTEASATSPNGRSSFVKNPDVFVSSSKSRDSLVSSPKERNSALVQSAKEFSIDFPMTSSATSTQSAKEFSIDFPINVSANNKRDSLGSDASSNLHHHSSSSLDMNTAGYSSTSLNCILESSLNLQDISERDEDVSDELLSSNKRSLSFTTHGSSGELTDIKNSQRQSQNKRHSTLSSLNGSLSNSSFNNSSLNNSSLNNNSVNNGSLNSSMGSHRSTNRHYNSSRESLKRHNSKERVTDSSTLKSLRKRLGRKSVMHNSAVSRPPSRASHVTFSESDRNERFDSIEGDIDASEQFFSDPKEPGRHSHYKSDGTEQVFTEPESNGQRHVNFRQIRQGKQSMMKELDEVERYLATLRQSVVDTRSSLTADSLITPDKDRSDRPGCPKDSTSATAPKSRRRFSMAYRSTEEVVTFPDDCFSFLILHGPKESPLFFWFAVGISILQLGFLVLALLSMVDYDMTAIGYTDNPQKLFFFFPTGVTGLMRCTQIFAIVSYCIFADMSVKDYLTAIELFPRYSKLEKGDKYWCMVFSCVLRFLMGILTVIVTVIMLLTNDNVIDTILDFLAMNFIGDIGKMAFQLCLWGKYGWRLEEEARRIEDMELPRCMLRKTSQRRYVISVIPILVFAFGLMLFLIGAQLDNKFWTTQTLKIQFYDHSPLEPYSGCYKRDSSRPWWFNNHRVHYEAYDHTLPGLSETTMGYCQSDKKWVLFDSTINADEACVDGEKKLLQSSTTSAYDIKDILGSSWYDGYGNAVSVSFSSDVDETMCEMGMFPHNGRCDSDLNNFDGNYDGGDCCASTCMGFECGFEGLKHMTIFGTKLTGGDGFPQCVDPSMKPITIEIENVISSWDYKEEQKAFINSTDRTVQLFNSGDGDSTDVIEPTMVLDCDDANVFTLRISTSMRGHMQTFNITDAADCTIRITSSTSSTESGQQPILYVNYTVYHGDINQVEEKPIVIAQEFSEKNEFLRFARFPECFFEKLSEYIDITKIYTHLGVEERAIRWLLYGSRFSSNFYCENDFFLERYALAAINFAAPAKRIGMDYAKFVMNFLSYSPAEQEKEFYKGMDEYLWLEDTRQCIWPAVECNKRSVEVLDLHNMNLTGPIASSIGLLTSLTKLDFSNNQFNDIIPTEIGKLTQLEDLNLANNDLRGTIPTEIGLLANLETLDLSGNTLLGGKLPTELAALKNLREIVLSNNQGLVITEDPGLREKVFAECSIDGCEPWDGAGNCSQWRDEHMNNRMQLQIDICAHFLNECYLCR